MYPSFYFIRHAQSIHNERASLVKSKNGLGKSDDISKMPEYREVKYGADYFDCGITEKGFGQCLQARQKCQNLDIGLVLTSPLYRAIVSGNEAFKNHKNNPKFIVEPLLGERMTSACDLGARLRQTMKQFPDYDYSQLVNNNIVDTWYIQNLPQSRRTVIYNKIKEVQATSAHEMGKVVLEQLQKKVFLESKKQLMGRIKKLKLKLLQYMQLTDKKIAIVGHSNMIKTLTATGFKAEGQPINGIEMENCEVDLIHVVMDFPVNEKKQGQGFGFCG